jgi:predicted GIY-YIG superfamily endonuclease
VRIYYVYMLRCIDGTFYVGITNDIMRATQNTNPATTPRATHTHDAP